MAFEFKLPDLGEGIHEAQVLAWKVRPGQQVDAFQPLCDVESAKAAVELTTPVAGRVVETRVAEGAVAHLGEVLVVIDTAPPGELSGDPPGPLGSPDQSSPPGPLGSPDQSGPPGPPDEWFGIVGSPPVGARRLPSAPQSAVPPRVLAAPFVRKLARDRGVRLEDINGSGPRGRVRIADLEAAAATRGSSTSSVAEPVQGASNNRSPEVDTGISGDRETLVPLQGLRKSIADHMVQAWRAAPQVTSMDLFDVTELVRAREVLRATAQSEGARLTYLPFFVKSAIAALRAVPEANAVVDDQQAVIRLKSEYNIGIATAIPGGLVVPVVKHADRLSLLEIAREIERLIAAARERHATPAELSGSTFTITSFGGLPGSPLFATPILNYPEVAILGLGRIDLQPRVIDNQVVARQCIGVSFTFDHRVLDGEAAGRFMAELKRTIEQPLELLLKLR